MSTTAPTGTASNGWIASIGTAFDNLIANSANTAAEVLPIWAANQLGLQNQNQLSQPTFQQPPNLPMQQMTTQNATSNAGMMDSFMNPKTLMLLGAGLVVGYLILR